MTVIEMVKKIRRDQEALTATVTSVWASLDAAGAGYRSAVAQIVNDAAEMARSLQPALAMIAAERERKRLMTSALEPLQPRVPVVPGLESILDEEGDDDPEDDRPYPGQYL